ncbi:MAG: hypothetical protein HOW73_19720 [Polyangiaceae bacterium]|nr:hypothetical protein [Polyangiaceae bacterium]
MSRAGALIFTCALLTGCYPEFQFGGDSGGDATSTTRGATSSGNGGGPSGNGGAPDTTTTGGASTNDGGDGGNGGDPTTPTSTSTGGAPMPVVPCGDGFSFVSDCAADEGCCFSMDSPLYDHCQAPSANEMVECGADYHTFLCDGPEDCPGTICCADLVNYGSEPGRADCQATCTGSQHYRMCNDADDCDVGQNCIQLFPSDYAEEYATYFKGCVAQ